MPLHVNKPAHLPPVAAHLLRWLESRGAKVCSVESVAYATLNGRTVFFLQDLHESAVLLDGNLVSLLPHPTTGGTQSVCGYLMTSEPDAATLLDMEESIGVKQTQLRVLMSNYAFMLRSLTALQEITPAPTTLQP